jgi:hypothetical protein
MAWRSEFLAALAGPRREPIFWVACERLADEPGQSWSACSHSGFGADDLLVAGSLQVQGATLDPYNGTTSIGAFSLAIWGTSDNIRRALRRGSVLVLRVGFAGFSLTDFEPVAFGVVRTWTGKAPVWTVQCHDLFTGLQNRLTVDALVCRLFDGLPTSDSPSTTLSSAVAVGDSSYPVASTALFGASGKETGGVGLLLVETSLGDSYYRLWSGVTTGPTAITIDTPATATVLNTVDVGASSGDYIFLVGYLSGHPLEIVRKILHSTGSGTNAYDTYPETWGYGIPYGYIDSDDIQTYIDATQAGTGATYWQWAQVGPVDSGLSFLQSFLAGWGGFLAIRQGKITARALFWSIDAAAVRVDTEITDAEVVSVDEYSAYDFTHQLEYTHIRVTTATNYSYSSQGEISTLPTGQYREFDLADRVFSAEGDHRDEVNGRLFEHQTRIPERLVLTLAGLDRAALCIGDLVKLTTTLVSSREQGDAGFNLRDVLVVEVSPDWVRGTVRVALLIYPTEEGY